MRDRVLQLNTYQFGKFWRPRVGGDNSFFGDPVFINSTQCSDCPLTFSGFISTNQDAVWLFQVPDCSSLCEELWVGQNLRQRRGFRVLQNKTCQSLRHFYALVGLGWVWCWRQISAECSLRLELGLYSSLWQACSHQRPPRSAGHTPQCTWGQLHDPSPSHRSLLACSPVMDSFIFS